MLNKRNTDRQRQRKTPAVLGGHVHDHGEGVISWEQWEKICGANSRPGTQQSERDYDPGENQNFFGGR